MFDLVTRMKTLRLNFKRHSDVENFAFNMNSTTENQVTVGQRFHDHVEE